LFIHSTDLKVTAD